MGYKPYYTGGWKSGEAGGTPITPEALNHMEAGIEAAGTHTDSTSNPHKVTAAQVGARPNTWTPTAKDVGALRNLGNNVINNINNDTTAKWAVVDSGYSFYTTDGLLNSQPSQWGILLHFKQDSDIFQIWNSQAGGPTYFRSGNNSGWNDSWRKAYDTANKPTASDVGAVSKSGDTMTASLKINGSWKGVSFGDNAAILNAGTRLTIDQRPQNSTGSFERYALPVPSERTADAWYEILTSKNLVTLAQGGTGSSGTSVSSASSGAHYAHFAKFGNLVVCTLIPKANRTEPMYSTSLTVPSGYRPKSAVSFSIYSNINKSAGGAGVATLSVATGGSLTISQTYGIGIWEAAGTYCWISA